MSQICLTSPYVGFTQTRGPTVGVFHLDSHLFTSSFKHRKLGPPRGSPTHCPTPGPWSERFRSHTCGAGFFPFSVSLVTRWNWCKTHPFSGLGKLPSLSFFFLHGKTRLEILKCEKSSWKIFVWKAVKYIGNQVFHVAPQQGIPTHLAWGHPSQEVHPGSRRVWRAHVSLVTHSPSPRVVAKPATSRNSSANFWVPSCLATTHEFNFVKCIPSRFSPELEYKDLDVLRKFTLETKLYLQMSPLFLTSRPRNVGGIQVFYHLAVEMKGNINLWIRKMPTKQRSQNLIWYTSQLTVFLQSPGVQHLELTPRERNWVPVAQKGVEELHHSVHQTLNQSTHVSGL